MNFENDHSHSQRQPICISVCIFISVAVLSLVLIRPVNGYIDIKQYCKAFDENFRPIICLIKNGTHFRPNYPPPPPPPPPSTTHHPILQPPPPSPTHYPILHPPPPDYMDFEENEDCSCEVTCLPRIIHQRASLQTSHHRLFLLRRQKRTTTTSYRCRSCGTECSVSIHKPPKCYCTIPATRSECTCTATCAHFREDRSYYFQREDDDDDDDDDAQCIFSVTALEDWRLGEERPPYVCECQRSKEAENSSRPDFICICQRVPIPM